MFKDKGPIQAQRDKCFPGPTTNTAPNKLPDYHEEQFDRYYAVNDLNSNWENDWGEDFTIPEEYFAHSYRVLNMFTQFKSMWDGNLRSIKAVQHQIELGRTDSKKFLSVSYCTGPKARELQE